MPWLIKMTYAYPDRLRQMRCCDGEHRLARDPRSPVRPARAWETDTWWERLDEDIESFRRAILADHILHCSMSNEPGWIPAQTPRPARATR